MRETPVCIVPARGTEPGLPKRNFKRLGGKPLVAYTIETALACDALDAVHVTTESEPLADLAAEYEAERLVRPDRLAASDVLLHEVVAHAVATLRDRGREVGPGTPVVVLQPNVPFRRPEDVTAALATFERGHEAVVSVVERRGLYWRADGDRLSPAFAERARRSELEPFYRETGSINVTTPALLDAGTRVGDAPGYVVTDRLSALAVDSVMDLWMAERVVDGPRIVFRVDGGDELGLGHVSRCRTLAAELAATIPCELLFVTDADYPAGARELRAAGYEVREAGEPMAAVADDDPDVLFMDVLDTDETAVRALHESGAAVINLEDSAGGLAGADFVINALYDDETTNGNHLAGAAYFVLREEFRDREPRLPEEAGRVLCSFGGSDPRGLSLTAARTAVDSDRRYRLVLGPDFDAREAVRRLVADAANVSLLSDPAMGEQMAWADLAVASGGRTLYELAATGTPTLVVAQNDREAARARRLDGAGVVEYLGHGRDVGPDRLFGAVDALATDRDRRERLAERGSDYVDGTGTRRILDVVFELLMGESAPSRGPRGDSR